jgi:hypothetical protein
MILALALTLAGAASASAEVRYATDPDPFIYNQLSYEHRALSHSDAVFPRSWSGRVATARASAANGGGESFSGATDPDPRMRSQLQREAPGKLW